MEFDSCLIPSLVHSISRFSVNQHFLSFHNWAAEFCWRKYNSHVAWCHYKFMVCKLSQPLSNSTFCWSTPSATAVLPNVSSCPQGPTQLLPCLRLSSQNLSGFKEPLGAIKLHSFNLLYSIKPRNV